MKTKPNFSMIWMAAPTAGFVALILFVLHLRGEQDPTAQVAFKARRVDLVGQLQLDLASASEAEKSAVLAVTDQESQTLADQARAASARVEQEDRDLGELLAAGGTQGEKELLARFTDAFVEYRRIDEELLALAVKNTNVKAYGLAFGPAAAAIGGMNEALSRIVAANADAPWAKPTMLFAFAAQTSALRIVTLLPPHIAEEGDTKMDALEARMAKEDAEVHKSLDGLTALPKLRDDPDLATAAARYADFSNLKAQILVLSRENTNVRSLSISLNEKRKVMLVCQATLGALQQAILTEPISGSTYGKPARPR